MKVWERGKISRRNTITPPANPPHRHRQLISAASELLLALPVGGVWCSGDESPVGFVDLGHFGRTVLVSALVGVVQLRQLAIPCFDFGVGGVVFDAEYLVVRPPGCVLVEEPHLLRYVLQPLKHTLLLDQLAPPVDHRLELEVGVGPDKLLPHVFEFPGLGGVIGVGHLHVVVQRREEECAPHERRECDERQPHAEVPRAQSAAVPLRLPRGDGSHKGAQDAHKIVYVSFGVASPVRPPFAIDPRERRRQRAQQQLTHQRSHNRPPDGRPLGAR
mmetsp:Transcript_52639/g.132291  ORF Transcript_52639/g.132291 Transcript_52639/m.132291 type:complete len:274 (-) Transcript_52639:430-1251(-)